MARRTSTSASRRGDIELPEWFPQIQFGSWDCQPRSGLLQPARLGALMDALERLVAIQEIRDQIARYAIFYDDKNWDDFAELWADDAAFVGPGMAFEGKRGGARLPHDLPARRLHRQAHELARR